MTVSSFNSVSIAPPLVLFSVARRAHSFAAWTASSGYAVNILSAEQEELSNRFARALADKWAGVATLQGDTGVPILADSLAVFECRPYARHDGGDHEIFVGSVVAMRSALQPDARPLIFFGGRYRHLDATFKDAPPFDARIFESW